MTPRPANPPRGTEPMGLREVSTLNVSGQMAMLMHAIEQLPQAVMVTGRDGTIEYVNRAFEVMSGYAREEVLNQRASILKSGKHDAEFFRRLWASILGGDAFQDVFINRNKDGTLFREYLTISPLVDNQGRIARFVAIGTDKSPPSSIRRGLLRQMKMLRLFAADFPGIVYKVRLGQKARTELLSKRALAMIGAIRIEPPADSAFPTHDLISPEERGRRQMRVDEAIRHNRPFELEYGIQRKDGASGRCLEYGMPICGAIDKPTHIFGVILDVTEHMRLQDDTLQPDKGLQEISARLLSLQETERKRIARDLHDGIGQILTSIKMRVETAGALIIQAGLEPDAIGLQEIVPMIQEAMQEVRNMSRDLRPSILDDLGIIATIAWFSRNFSKTYETIRVETDLCLDEGNVPVALKTTIYRVLQEAMNNVAKHANANLTRVRLKNVSGRIELTIEDNGNGFDLQKISTGSHHGLGLASMQERVKMSGGEFSIRTALRIGTVVRAAWPRGSVNDDTP